MSLTIAPSSIQTPALRRGTPLQLLAVGNGRWRVMDAAGRIAGHLDALLDPRGVRYRARRYHPGSRAFRDLGDFWSADDAVDCLRFAR
ncbi:MAG: hypothetical protein J0I44_05725 [Microbacterium sp.]|uniref:hypothetical protein n=1 Tax=Microbacterium sp. TaxID=51671 RepID=UPI001AC61835|nr:hypothetical protein [Microbacterium sp.]MBN9152865.1 hypothetical protein [Microbacterium sp.]MBN9195553.1 hypothetical protein [Microbacterium sp.]